MLATCAAHVSACMAGRKFLGLAQVVLVYPLAINDYRLAVGSPLSKNIDDISPTSKWWSLLI